MEPTIEQIKKMLDSHKWIHEEAKASIQFMDHWKTCHFEASRTYKKEFYTMNVYSFEGDYCFEQKPADESIKMFEHFLQAWTENKQHLLSQRKKFDGVSIEIERLYNESLKDGFQSLESNKIIDLYKKIHALGKEFYGYSIISDSADALGTKDFEEHIPKNTKMNQSELVVLLSTPTEHSNAENECIDLFDSILKSVDDKLLLKAISNKNFEEASKNKKFMGLLKEHTFRFQWMHNGFNRAVQLDEKYFFNSASDLISGKNIDEITLEKKRLEEKPVKIIGLIEEAIKQHKLSKSQQEFFELIRFFSILQDARKVCLQRLGHCIGLVLTRAEKDFGVPLEELYKYRITEIVDLFQKQKRLTQNVLTERYSAAYVSYLKGDEPKTEFVVGKESEFVWNYFKQQREELTSKSVIEGMVASRGEGKRKIRGRVRILYDPSKDYFEQGEILVTGMTRPEFVPLMKKALAIITNEGGITTHAAIVSRELKTPCIVGTKIATEVLRTGDMVEINLDNGTIVKLR